MRNILRQNDTMIAVESRSATITFGDILEATEVVADQHESMTPWERCDRFEHIAWPLCDFDHSDVRDMQGYVRTSGCGKRYVINLPAGEDYGVYEYARSNGASRGVAAEMVAAERRRTLAQLVKWHRDGWEWYGVCCQIDVLGEEYEASLWGIDDPDYAEREVKEEIALEVAGQLEKSGYTVTDKPEYRKDLSRADKQARLSRNLATQNWKA